MASKLTFAPAALVASAVVSASDSTGPVVSVTVTLNEPVEVLSLLSDDEQFTVVVPIGKVLPDAGVQVTVVVLLSPASNAVAV